MLSLLAAGERSTRRQEGKFEDSDLQKFQHVGLFFLGVFFSIGLSDVVYFFGSSKTLKTSRTGGGARTHNARSMSAKKRIHFIRHGHGEHLVAGGLGLQTFDPVLTAQGWQDVRQIKG